METVKCHFSRKKSFFSAAFPYRVLIDGKECGLIYNGGELDIEIPDKRCSLCVSMWGNKMTLHRLEKSVVLFPEYCKQSRINCEITTKPNYLALLSLGVLQAVASIDLSINYL